MNFRILRLVVQVRIVNRIDHTTKLTIIMDTVFSSIADFISAVINDAPLEPFTSIKYVIAAIANPPQIEPKYLKLFS